MNVTDEQLDKWIEDAEKATQGEWHAGFYDGRGSISSGRLIDGNYKPVCRSDYDVCYSEKYFDEDGDPLIENVEYRGPCLKYDAIHVANSQPNNFITVLKELKELRAVVAQRWHASEVVELREKVKALELENTWLRERNESLNIDLTACYRKLGENP